MSGAPPGSAGALPGERLACSWSGGKDGALALHEAVAAGGMPVALVTMCTEAGERTRSHGLARAVIEAQAAALGLPLVTAATGWDGYEAAFVAALERARDEHGASAAVFGDIDIERHRAWERRVSAAAGLSAHLPLWGWDRPRVLERVWAHPITAHLVAVRDGVLDRGLLGRALDRSLVDAIAATGADACGENGEYHTVVTDAPLFDRPAPLTAGRTVRRADCWFLDLDVDSPVKSRHLS